MQNMVKCKGKIAILMSTFNGSKFLAEQIESILSQTYDNWNLYIRDDGSTDATDSIIDKYVMSDERIYSYRDDLGNIKTRASFLTMLENIDAEFYAFCDQDDIWLPNKLEFAISSMIQNSEADLYHSNVTIVDENAKVLEQNYWRKFHFLPEKRFTLLKTIVNPSVIGMTMMLRRRAKDYIFPYTAGNMLLHDSWCAIKTIQKGPIISDVRPTVLYRQHSNNVCGLNYFKYSNDGRIKKIKNFTKNNYEKYRNMHFLFRISLFEFLITKIELIIDGATYRLKQTLHVARFKFFTRNI